MDFPDGCPICGGENNGRGTCDPCRRTVDTFRNLIRNLQRWRASYEDDPELETLPSPDGRDWLLWDVEKFYEYRRLLPEQQKRCIEIFLYENYFERETAERMGVGRGEHTSVAIYATVGLIKLLSLARAGQLPGCRFEFDVDMPEPVLVIEPIVLDPVWQFVRMRFTVRNTPLVISYPLLEVTA